MENNTKEDYPMRLNRFLALRGVATRRAADELIRRRAVRIDGKIAHLGDRVSHREVLVEVDERGEPEKNFRYVAYYKPRGVVTHSSKRGERDVQEATEMPELYPVGRLDKESEGLIVLTNDGRVTERLLHPRFEHEKEYRVTVRERIEPRVVKLLLAGVMSEGDLLCAKKVEITGNHQLTIVLTQGKKHQIRRMLDGAHLTVTELVRTRIMAIHLGALRPGATRSLVGRARQAFLESLGLK